MPAAADAGARWWGLFPARLGHSRPGTHGTAPGLTHTLLKFTRQLLFAKAQGGRRGREGERHRVCLPQRDRERAGGPGKRPPSLVSPVSLEEHPFVVQGGTNPRGAGGHPQTLPGQRLPVVSHGCSPGRAGVGETRAPASPP